MQANWNEIDASLDYLVLDRQAKVASVYASSLKNVKGQMASLYEKHGELTFSEMVKYNRMQQLEKNLTSELKDMGKKVKSVTSEAIKTGFEDSYYKTGFMFENHTGLNLGFSRIPKDQVNAILDDPFDWKTKVVNNVTKLKANIKDVIAKGLIQGVSYPKMAMMLTKRMKMGANDSMRIIRTEGHRAQVKGRLHGIERTESAAERLGVKTKRKWSSTSDDRTRSSHVSMNGKFTDKNDMFTFPSGLKTEGPGLSGDPGEDINCRCQVQMIFEGYEPDVEASKGMESRQGFACLNG